MFAEPPSRLFHHLCRFSNTLLQENLYAFLFAEVKRQLEEENLLVKGVNGVIVDATIIEFSPRPRKVVEIMPEDRKEEKAEVRHCATYYDDGGAAWIRKGNGPYYGYNALVSADAKPFTRAKIIFNRLISAVGYKVGH